MFTDIGPMEVVTLVVLAVLIFGPDKLPKLIQDVSNVIRKVRSFSESAKQDIRSELGPEFKDFEFEDLHPKTFVRKQLMGNDDLGLKEIRNSFDLRKDIEEVADAVNGREAATAATAVGGSVNGSAGTPDMFKKREKLEPGERPPFDADAT
ncbi:MULTISPECIES: sec-independent translocase [unclassified Streptomyces]|uniref:sec-independent translocase n=1 Tax=unclassified Streptomyces TaxID=2593676 RepID=UPI0037F9A4CD